MRKGIHRLATRRYCSGACNAKVYRARKKTLKKEGRN